eukprot:CAMPEP_0177659768 /NCGR_PEP_ID=MMETSP0447-20121125/17629_1 /TAXON_ID=0 /ORGANISM="Stygamoeba regulata, Strain BSH-02190019" /LENGTH=362 /DNA_ID=CAMNT_0019164681 /DNA_START=362 /DNA_END=1450 /DNA_ORIENTATION=-
MDNGFYPVLGCLLSVECKPWLAMDTLPPDLALVKPFFGPLVSNSWNSPWKIELDKIFVVSMGVKVFTAVKQFVTKDFVEVCDGILALLKDAATVFPDAPDPDLWEVAFRAFRSVCEIICMQMLLLNKTDLGKNRYADARKSAPYIEEIIKTPGLTGVEDLQQRGHAVPLNTSPQGEGKEEPVRIEVPDGVLTFQAAGLNRSAIEAATGRPCLFLMEVGTGLICDVSDIEPGGRYEVRSKPLLAPTTGPSVEVNGASGGEAPISLKNKKLLKLSSSSIFGDLPPSIQEVVVGLESKSEVGQLVSTWNALGSSGPRIKQASDLVAKLEAHSICSLEDVRNTSAEEWAIIPVPMALKNFLRASIA